MEQAIYRELKQVAMSQSTTTYGQIANVVQMDLSDPGQRQWIFRALGEISTHEHAQGRPMLSAVVISAEDGVPGQGFFTLARELGKLKGDDELAFFVGELARTHAVWKPLSIKS